MFASITAALAGVRTRIAHVAATAGDWRRLPQMDERMLQDLGVSRAQAEFELSHPRRTSGSSVRH